MVGRRFQVLTGGGMSMKKIVISFLILTIFVVGTIPCLADTDGNVFEGESESEEIMQDIDIILNDVNFCEITQEDIDFTDIIRAYVSVNLPDINIKNPDEMKEYLKNYDYIYYVPAHKETGENAGDYYLTIAKGQGITDEKAQELNFTDEQIEEMRRLEGKWNVPAVALCVNKARDPEITNYWKNMSVFLDLYDIKNSKTFFIGRTITKSSVTGVCFVEGLNEPYYVALDEIDVNAESVEDIKNSVFTYEEVKEYTWEKYYDSAEPGYDGGTNTAVKTENSINWWIYVAAAVVVATVAAALIVKRTKKAR